MQDTSSQITAVFTSCGRFDLLYRTLSSFLTYCDLPLYDIIVIDNSTLPETEAELIKIAERINYPFSYIINSVNIGQIASIDTAYSHVSTDYIFHCEDDWEFFDTGFMSKSKRLLEEYDNIVNVNLRVRFDGEKGSMHPISELLTSATGILYHKYELNYLGAWHGFSWNPGLRRLFDYNLIKPFKFHGDESIVGQAYKNEGYIAACLDKSYCRHIGTHSTTPLSNQ